MTGEMRPGRRLLLVHAHPDDESIETGATMARYAAAGAGVTLVTCTRGELGEVIPPELAHLAAGLAGEDNGLGRYRAGELAAACQALGVADHRFLGGAGRWTDSGMRGEASNDAPGCFWQADVEVAARALLEIIAEVEPQVLVSYDADGYYGHPDHIQAHRVASRAFELAAGRVAKLYATAMPASALARITEPPPAARRPPVPGDRAPAPGHEPAPGAGFRWPQAAPTRPFGVPDDVASCEVDAAAHLPAKLAAMRAHATQVIVDDPFFALSDQVGQRALGVEYFTLLAGPRGPAAGRRGRERDLFAGLE